MRHEAVWLLCVMEWSRPHSFAMYALLVLLPISQACKSGKGEWYLVSRIQVPVLTSLTNYDCGQVTHFHLEMDLTIQTIFLML